MYLQGAICHKKRHDVLKGSFIILVVWRWTRWSWPRTWKMLVSPDISVIICVQLALQHSLPSTSVAHNICVYWEDESTKNVEYYHYASLFQFTSHYWDGTLDWWVQFGTKQMYFWVQSSICWDTALEGCKLFSAQVVLHLRLCFSLQLKLSRMHSRLPVANRNCDGTIDNLGRGHSMLRRAVDV